MWVYAFYYISYGLGSIKNLIRLFSLQHKNKQILTTSTTLQLSTLSQNEVVRTFIFLIIYSSLETYGGTGVFVLRENLCMGDFYLLDISRVGTYI